MTITDNIKINKPQEKEIAIRRAIEKAQLPQRAEGLKEALSEDFVYCPNL